MSSKPAYRYTSFNSSHYSTTSTLSKVKNEHNFAALVKKFMDKRKQPKSASALPLPRLIDEKLIHNAKKPHSKLGALPNKLFGSRNEENAKNKKKKEPLALTEVKPNTRTLAMVLRSERELLSANQQQQSHIADLQSLLHHRSLEVEKLKDLCLKQREEIKALKSAILFPDEMDSQLHIIPSLQTQISCLTNQLHSLSQDLAQVKAPGRSTDGSFSSPTTPFYDQHLQDPAHSLDFSSGDPTMPNSPENLLLKDDVNPCLTPRYSKTKSKEYDAMSYSYTKDKSMSDSKLRSRKLSTSSDHLRISASGSSTDEAFCRSVEGKYRYRNRIL